ncbi:MAG: hypothetical protein A2096_15390 [Spirochaetes bacterium GWF1_41_5]|nr:MAG: hypothetical protein A2096_15390 [Spirochaetes bacterium GWF1_41_5]HBE01897.1 hypothetical protein [Spirochaetia bacterium]
MWKSYYYEKENGEKPVHDFIESCNEKEQAKILSWVEMLETQGPVLPRPFADILEDGIHELRLKVSGDQVRILYYFCFKDYVILTNTFIKTTDKVPKKEIETAKKYRTDFHRRFNEKNFKEELNEVL